MISFLEGLSFSELMLVFVAILLLIQFIPSFMESWDKLHQKTGWQKSSEIKDKEQGEKIKKLEDRLDKLEKKVDCTASEFLHNQEEYHGQSIEIRGELADSISKMAERQEQIIERVDALSEKTRKYQLADMRETLLQAHRYYTSDITNPLHKWTDIEAHAWNEQYETYKDNGGNGYMESDVKPDMDKLDIVRFDDYESMAELMTSRSQCNK